MYMYIFFIVFQISQKASVKKTLFSMKDTPPRKPNVQKNLFHTDETPPGKRPRYYEFMSPRFLPSPEMSNLEINRLQNVKEEQGVKIPDLKKQILQQTLKQLDTIDKVELFLVAKCGLKDAMLIFQSLNHVPSRFPQYLDYVCNILVAGGVSKHFSAIDELKETLLYISDTYSVNKFDSPLPDDILWEATNTFGTSHLGFVLTKAEACLEDGCHGKLYGRKKDAVQVTVYTLNGPLPFLKTTLVCRKCESRYCFLFTITSLIL